MPVEKEIATFDSVSEDKNIEVFIVHLEHQQMLCDPSQTIWSQNYMNHDIRIVLNKRRDVLLQQIAEDLDAVSRLFSY